MKRVMMVKHPGMSFITVSGKAMTMLMEMTQFGGVRIPLPAIAGSTGGTIVRILKVCGIVQMILAKTQIMPVQQIIIITKKAEDLIWTIVEMMMILQF
jgi:hypothetical protein